MYQHFAEQIDELHFFDRPWDGLADSWIGHHDSQALRPRDGHVDAVPIQDEREAAGTIFSIAGTERQDADGCLLFLKFIHTADSRFRRQHCLKRTHLGIVRGNEQKIVQCLRPGRLLFGLIRSAKQLMADCGIRRCKNFDAGHPSALRQNRLPTLRFPTYGPSVGLLNRPVSHCAS